MDISLAPSLSTPPSQRLDHALLHGHDLSRSQAKALIQAGHVHVDGRTVRKPSFHVKPHQRLEIKKQPERPHLLLGTNDPLDIVYEDTEVSVINKGAGVVMHPAPGHWEGTLVHALIGRFGPLPGEPDRPGLVHRLDKDTTGLLVVARTDRAYDHLRHQFTDRTIQRCYTAMVWGVPAPGEGTIVAPIGRHPVHRKKMTVSEKGRPATTHYKLLATSGEVSLLSCTLETGRTHQIRVHMHHKGYPLVGDPTYGKRKKQPFSRQALHAQRLSFLHPATGNLLTFERQPPYDMCVLIEKLLGSLCLSS